MSDFRVIMIVLASDNEPLYCKMQSLWKLAKHPRVDIFFLKAHPNIRGEDFIHENTIYIGCPETLDHVYEKQMRCFRLLLPHLKNYAFVFRTNLSSHVDIPTYLEYCATLPTRGVYGGVVGIHGDTTFASGSGFTITPDLIERLVRENPPEVFVDDVSIGAALSSWGVPVIPAYREDYTPLGWVAHRDATCRYKFHRRIKTENRDDDIRVLTLLFEGATQRLNMSRTKFIYYK